VTRSQPMQGSGAYPPLTGASRPKPTTSYHVRDLRPAHYDVLNRPRRPPIPDTGRHDAPPDPNDEYGRVEMAVRRHTHTSSVMQRSIIVETQRLNEGWADATTNEAPLGDKMFRLRPRQAAFGNVAAGRVFRHKLVLTNVSVELARFRVVQPKSDRLSVVYTPGGMAAGMSIVIEVECFSTDAGMLTDQLTVETEGEVFRIPITANVMPQGEYSAWEATGGVVPKHVKQMKSAAPKRMMKSKPAQLGTLVSLQEKHDEPPIIADLQVPCLASPTHPPCAACFLEPMPSDAAE